MSMERRRAGRYTDNDYFRMGAAIAVGELYDMAAFGRFLEDDREVKWIGNPFRDIFFRD